MPAYSAKLQGVKFIDFLRKRLILLRELLADDGSIYVRIDYHFGHYVKVIMDEVFGKNNFRNEIVVSKSNRIKTKGTRFLSWHDILLVYAKNYNSIFFNHITISRGKEEWRQMDNDGEQWSIVPQNVLRFHSQKNIKYDDNGNPISRAKIILGQEFLPPKGRRFPSQETIFELEKEKLIRLNANSRPIMKKPDEIPLTDNWTDISSYSTITSYPTENSEQLLDRVIRTSSKEGDMVLDCFAGSGTAGAVSEKLGRRWIMVDCRKFAIYIITKRLFSLKEEMGNKGKPLKSKPFVLYNAGKYYDSRFIQNMSDEDYVNFALEIFQAEHKESIVNGYKLNGLLRNSYVAILDRKVQLTEDFLNDFNEVVGSHVKGKIYLVAPAGNVAFLNDHITIGEATYVILRIPYSIIEEIINKRFTELVQPRSLNEVNQTIESVGFDFIEPPEVTAQYHTIKNKNNLAGDELVIEIKKFSSNEKTKHVEDLKEKDFLSMVLVDSNFGGDFFNMTRYFFAEDIRKDNDKVRIPLSKAGKQIMIIYLDIFGNELREVKQVKDFVRK